MFVSTIDDLEKEIAALSRAEQAELAQRLVQALGDTFPGIECTAGVCGGEPCIVRTRIPVWVLEAMRRQGVQDGEILRSYPTLRAEDLANAWAYVRAHRKEIEQQIRDNEGD
jgi:uncharacterized protein (DUF433 family)